MTNPVTNITIECPLQSFEVKKYDIFCHIINEDDPEKPTSRTEVLKPGESRTFQIAVTSRFITAVRPSIS